MKVTNIFKTAAVALASLALLTGCVKSSFQEITELALSRCLEPQNLSARVDVATGDNVTFGWDVNKDADSYTLVVYNDEEMTHEVLNQFLKATEVPYTVRLEADQKYTFKVQAMSEIREPSNWAVFDGSAKTYAVKDNLFLEVTGRSETSISLAWSKEVSDYKEVTHISATPVKGGKAVKKDLTAAEKNAAAATIDGLQPGTEYQVVLFYLSASRGARDTWTKASQGSAVKISSEEELKTALAAGGDIYLALSGSPYNVSDVKPAASVKLVGELAGDGSRPEVIVRFVVDEMAAGSSLYFEGISFNGNADKSRVVERSTAAAVDLTGVTFINCEIFNYKAGLFYEGDKADAAIHVSEFLFDSCDIHDILASGGDAFDIRKNGQVDRVVFNNNTIWDGIRSFFRVDQVDANKLGKVEFTNNTVKNICTINDTNNRGLFSFYVPVEFVLKNNLFLWEDGGKTAADAVDYTQLVQDNSKTVDPTITASGNYTFAEGKDFFKRVDAASAGMKVLTEDPCYNSKGNFFQLSNQDLIDEQVGASKWWISYVEKPEDLTQNVLTGAHTWNLQDASLFAGEVKNSRVRDELMLVGTEATPLNADGGINFLSASVLTRKGVPSEGYASFKVNKPGSVDLLVSDPQKAGGSVVVALYDDNGLAVKGGASASSNGVQKVLIPEVKGEGTVYLYALAPVSIVKLAWSEDTKGGNSVLATPRITVEPVTLKEGEEAEVTVSWEAVAHAASYELKFNKRPVELEEGATSYTVPAETIAALEAGLYNFTVQAFPAEEDIYYVKSEIGNASIAIQPQGGGEEVVQKSLVWDFTAEYISDLSVQDKQVYLYDAGTLEVASSFAEDKLYFSPNEKAVKHASKASNADGITYHPITYGGGAAYMFIHTTRSGKLRVTATVGKSVADNGNCKLGVKIGEKVIGENVELVCYDTEKALLGAEVYEWDITNETGAPQDIQIVKPGGSNSPWIFKVEFIYSEGGAAAAEEYKWNFTNEYISDLAVQDKQVYLYDAGTLEVASSYAENKLYFSPNEKAVKHATKACNADGITYHPITYGGGAAYMFIHTSKSGKLRVTATIGKSVTDTGNCKLGVKIGDNVIGENVDLVCYDPDKAGMGAEVYEWDITNETGAPQDIQIVKPGGSNSPWIFEVVFIAK